MNNISSIYVNAFLADAAYIDLPRGKIDPDADIYKVLSKRMTSPLAKFIADNFEVISNRLSNDLIGTGFDAIVWKGRYQCCKAHCWFAPCGRFRRPFFRSWPPCFEQVPENGAILACVCHSFFESKFKAPKTPLSHGLTGFAAIKPVAKSAMVFEAWAAARNGLWAGLVRALQPPGQRFARAQGFERAFAPGEAVGRRPAFARERDLAAVARQAVKVWPVEAGECFQAV